MLIYKIFRRPEWQSLQAVGLTKGAPIDLADGYIHFSTAAQARETAAKHFAGADDLVLAAVDAAALGGALRWETSRNDDHFPHLYDKLALPSVVWFKPLLLLDGVHQFPAEMV